MSVSTASARTTSTRRLYSSRPGLYETMIGLLRYPQGLTRYFAQADFLRPDLKVLDAGCGTGAATIALHTALAGRHLLPARFHAFDVTPRMLRRFARHLDQHPVVGIELEVADALDLGTLPAGWWDYDLIISSAMLEYLPKADLAAALESLRLRLRPAGTLVVFITRQSPYMVPFIGRWWHANLYDKSELHQAFRQAGFRQLDFQAFPRPYRYLNWWGHVVVARL
ncbi:class I SAM-dependent methyltransferase [Hymenobacter sp. BT188]|nr:class I SAM-dependent methyltransferase [Hymenobacter sp. BT188]MBC6609176.1 class I SAM-dependent methyltransferase [Hymenobacter sp. BT188]